MRFKLKLKETAFKISIAYFYYLTQNYLAYLNDNVENLIKANRNNH